MVSLTQYYTATTLDGFTADPDNSLDWLFTRQRERDGPLNYAEFSPASVRWRWGRRLDHEVADKAPSEWKWPYNIPCWVFTHRQLPVVPNARIEFTSADIATVYREMSAPLETGTSGSSVGELWPVSSPTPGCWTRSS